MPLLIVILGILALLFLIVVLKLNAFIAFVIVSLLVGVAAGMELTEAVLSVQRGMGDTLGFLVLILGLGSMLGKLVADSGAAQRITTRLVNLFGKKYIQWAVVLAGFIVGVPMFFSVGFVILIPLLFTIAVSTGIPLLFIAIPMVASLSVTHGLLPPHPAPSAIGIMFDADLGKILIYGIIISIPVIIISGPVFSHALKSIRARPIKEFISPQHLDEKDMPGTGIAILTTLLPVILIGASFIADMVFPGQHRAKLIFNSLGDPVIAMLISVVTAIFTLGIARGRKVKDIMSSLEHSISSITMVLLIIAGAGGLKDVLVDSGISDYIGQLFAGSGLSPLILGWVIAAMLRISVGSATVAALTTAGILLPVTVAGGVSRELMVLSIGAGSLIFSHVNDGGFWLFKEYFGLTIRETFLTWTAMETLISVLGLLGVLLLNLLI